MAIIRCGEGWGRAAAGSRAIATAIISQNHLSIGTPRQQRLPRGTCVAALSSNGNGRPGVDRTKGVATMRYGFWLAVPVALLGAQPAAPQAPAAVNVQLSNFKFTPRTIVLDHGRPYALRLYNASGGGHDFTAREFFAAASIAPGDRR